MSTPNALEQLAARIVAQAKPGEQIEAYVSRGGETSVRVYEGEVEHFVSAQSESVGIRVVRDGRTGYAYAGTLDESVLHEVLAEARAIFQATELARDFLSIDVVPSRPDAAS